METVASQSTGEHLDMFARGLPSGFPDTQNPRAYSLGLRVIQESPGGRRWFRTTDPLLVSYGLGLSSVSVHSRISLFYRIVRACCFCCAEGYFSPFWRLLFTIVHQDQPRAPTLRWLGS